MHPSVNDMSHLASSFNPRRFVVIGGSLAAGFGDFSLHRESQHWSFPAQMARQMGVELVQPLFEPPGIGEAPGFERQPVILPNTQQSTVYDHLPPDEAANLSVPGFTLRDALHRRPTPPLIWRDDSVQTACNLILGARDLPLAKRPPLPTQVEHATSLKPSLLVVELGFTDALQAAVAGNPELLTGPAPFRSDIARVLSSCASALVVILTAPDPFDTPYFSSLAAAAETLRVEPSFIEETYGLRQDDFLRLPALHEIGFHLFARKIGGLPPDGVVPAAAAASVRRRVEEWNEQIRSAAAECGALVFDLHAYLRHLARVGAALGSRILTAAYLGGLYRLNGAFPGRTGHGLIANQVLCAIERATGQGFPPVDLCSVMTGDPAATCSPTAGRKWTVAELRSLARTPKPFMSAPSNSSPPPSMTSSSPAPLEVSQYGEVPLPSSLTLPPGLEQVLALDTDSSYFGDGISASLCSDPNDIRWGNAGNHIFGGFALVDSHLHGNLRLRFSPPVNQVTRFEVFFEGGLAGDDSVLACPIFFRMPFQCNRVDEVPGKISSGELNLETGAVTKLRIYARYSSAALNALVSANPTFPSDPLFFVSLDVADPLREYGSAWGKFTQRSDGRLDFTFYGSRYVPLGPGVKWPLNFKGPDGPFALIPADGTVMHPHLRLSTSPAATPSARPGPAIPVNSVEELTFHTHNSAFGDAFLLHVRELGGIAKGRSHVLGRSLVQFGVPSGGTTPVAITNLGPGGVFTSTRATRVTEAFPGRITPGPSGFDEILRFPLRSYPQNGLNILDDPFDVPIGAIDLRTGALFGEHLHRGFIEQDLIYSLMRVEPRTPRNSFYFRGAAVIEPICDDRLAFRHRAQVHVFYPKNFEFPAPDLDHSYTVIRDSALDPHLWIRAVRDLPSNGSILEGGEERVLGSAGELFSYRFRISADPALKPCFFEYVNHSQDGRFELLSLAWVGFGKSLVSGSNRGRVDTVTFSGFGVWEKSGTRTLQQVAVQICTNPQAAYFGVQVDSGDISNVNTKPGDERMAFP